jgi:hypothetical protein
MITNLYICFLLFLQGQLIPTTYPIFSVERKSFWEGNSIYEFYSNGTVIITNTKWDGSNKVVHKAKIPNNKIDRFLDTLVQIGLPGSTNLSMQIQFDKIAKETGVRLMVSDARNYHIKICRPPLFYDAQQEAPRRYADKYKSVREFRVFSDAVDLFEIFIETNNLNRFGPERKKHGAD